MNDQRFGDNVAEIKRPVIPCIRTFKQYGKSGIPVSDWFPHVGGVIDEIAVVRSMWCHEGNHFPAVIETCTGHRGRAFDHPKLAAALSKAAGATYAAGRLPFDGIEFLDEKKAIRFTVDGTTWKCDLTSYECSKGEAAPAAPADVKAAGPAQAEGERDRLE